MCNFLKQQKYLALFSSNGAEGVTVGNTATIFKGKYNLREVN